MKPPGGCYYFDPLTVEDVEQVSRAQGRARATLWAPTGRASAASPFTHVAACPAR